MNVVHANVDILSTAVLKMLAALLQKSVKYSNSVMESKTIYIVIVLQLAVSLAWRFNGSVKITPHFLYVPLLKMFKVYKSSGAYFCHVSYCNRELEIKCMQLQYMRATGH